MQSDWLTLPHPRALDRRFVLAPAAEVLPTLRWPGTGATLEQHLEQLPVAEPVERLEVAGW